MVPELVRPEISTAPPALVMNRALPPLLVSRNCRTLPALLVMVALPAVLVSEKAMVPMLLMVALPAVLVLKKRRMPKKSL